MDEGFRSGRYFVVRELRRNMSTEQRFGIFALLFMAIAIVGAYVYKTKQSASPAQGGKNFAVQSIRMISVEEYEFVLQDNNRMRGKLRGGVSPEAKDEIIKLLNTVQRGRIEVVACQVGGPCIVELFLTAKDGAEWAKDINLWDWLVQRKLAYQTIPGPKPNPKK